MKKRTTTATAAVVAASAMLALAGCTAAPAPAPAPETPDTPVAKDITLWLMGGDTPQTLRDYLIEQYAEVNGGTLTIEEQGWGDALTKLQTQLPDSANTPDVVEIGNTWSPTFTTVGAFSDITDLVPELGGSDLLPSFVDIGIVDEANYALPYYFGSRYNFYRKDLYEAAGLQAPKTLDEFAANAAALTTDSVSGFYLGGSDWRNGVSWIFAYGGDLAKRDGGEWVSTLSDPKSIEGLTALQELFQSASHAPITENDAAYWDFVNTLPDADGPEAATIIAPGWAHWSIGDLAPAEDDPTKFVATWNDDVFGTFVLPGVDGGVAPVFAGGSNIAISAASQHQAGAKDLLRIIFSPDYQTMLGENGLGPANLKYTSSLGDDQFAQALAESAAKSKLTPAAPGWAAVEASGLLEEFFGKVNAGGDIAALAAEYDTKIGALLNG